jgi:hypothetical protein
MTPEDVQNEIKLIFARACAESLKDTADAILGIEDGDVRKRAAEAHGAAFASAFIVVSRYFTGESVLTFRPETLVAEPAHTDQSSSTHEAGSQQPSAPPGQS